MITDSTERRVWFRRGVDSPLLGCERELCSLE